LKSEEASDGVGQYEWGAPCFLGLLCARLTQ
jgi:hypothetical protein